MLAFFPIFFIAVVVIGIYWLYYLIKAVIHNDKHDEEQSKKLSTLGAITFVVLTIGYIIFGGGGGSTTFVPIPVSII